VLDAEGDATAADEGRWALFERTLSEEPLRALLAKLADFEDVVALIARSRSPRPMRMQ
jgi:arginyl-tRNA synthetase